MAELRRQPSRCSSPNEPPPRWYTNVVFADPPLEVTQADGSRHTVPSFLQRFFIPVRLRDASPATVKTYRIIARNRLRWFCQRDTCRIPTPDEAAQFL